MAATIFPLLVAIYALYDEEGGVTRFGKGLFMGMAYVAGAGSIITLLGAARWLALQWLVLFHDGHWLVFVLGMAFFVMIMTNFIMNVAAIAISMPVALVIAPYLSVSGHVVMFAALATAGMPFLCLVGAAPNAIAYESRQFTSGEFFKAGIPASILLMLVLALFVFLIWPLMGMPVRVAAG